LHAALAQLRTWHDEGRRHLYVSVNVSAVEFARPSFVQDVRDALSHHGLPGEALVLELTESALLRDLPTSVEQLHALRAHGVRVAVDDFGTGYSNLSHLQDLPVHVIKIDRSFVQHLERKGPALVSAIIALARHLDLCVIIEGVETDEQKRTLHELGGTLGQGYLFGRPVPAAALSFGERGSVHE